MAAAQTLPNIQGNPKFASSNSQSGNTELTFDVIQVRLTAAQLLALKTTPIQLTPTPNPGEVICVHCSMFKYTFVTTAYTLNAGTLKLFFGPVANAHAMTADLSTSFLTAAASRVISNVAGITVASDTIANGTGQPIFVGNDGAANYTLGDAVVDITLIYSRSAA